MHRALAAALLVLAACSAQSPAASPAPLSPESAAPPPARPPNRQPSALVVELRPKPKEGTLHVDIVSNTAPPRVWSLADGRAVRITDVVARDRSGSLSVSQRQLEDGTTVMAVDRVATAPVELSYVVAPKVDAASSDVCRFVIEPDRASFCGEQVLALPSMGSGRTSTRLRLVADGTFLADAASSFGLADDLETAASAIELSSAMFVFGNLTTAEMRAPEGRDHAAALGYVSFDPRWVAAEAAGFRTAIDKWLHVARPADDPSVGVLILAGRHPERPISLRRRARGLALSADVSADFTSGARIRVAQIFAQRTVGGSLWLGDRSGADEARGLWFSEGVSRAVALFALHELGAIDDAELAADINSFLAEGALSGDEMRGVEELAARARSNDPFEREAAIRALMARGVLVAVDLGPDALRKVLRAVIEDARSRRAGEVSREAFLAAVREAAGERKAARISRSLDEGRVAIERSALGPCLELVERPVAPFELGFVLAGKEKELRIEALVPGSAAARAGLRESDVVQAIEYRPDRSDVPVDVTVSRGGARRELRFLPAGASKPGRAFVRAKRAPRSCERS